MNLIVQWADILNKSLSKSQICIEYSIESTFKNWANTQNIIQIIKEATSLIKDNIIGVGNFIKEIFNNLPTASSLRQLSNNMNNK
jgi:hypothetical protein